MSDTLARSLHDYKREHKRLRIMSLDSSDQPLKSYAQTLHESNGFENQITLQRGVHDTSIGLSFEFRLPKFISRTFRINTLRIGTAQSPEQLLWYSGIQRYLDNAKTLELA
ncbi:hypothetical protein ACJJTC_016990 [Scirpophaga incertulas]